MKGYGCTPNARTPKVMSYIKSMAVPWDGNLDDIPDVVQWDSFEEVLSGLPQIETQWWKKYDWKEYFVPSQDFRPCCAGFAMANAAMARTLIQTAFQFSEQKPEKFNPFLTWLLSKGGSPWGGQSIGAMAKYGNEIGNFLVADIGEYDPRNLSTSRSKQANTNAAKHQICYTIYEGKDPASAILDACSKGFTCFIGNDREVADGTFLDSNGVECVQLSGRHWSHAQAHVGYKVVNGTQYVFWLNSHGPIYSSNDGTPDIGGWMPEETLREHMGGTFADLAIIIYSECPYDPTIKPTLNVT